MKADDYCLKRQSLNTQAVSRQVNPLFSEKVDELTRKLSCIEGPSRGALRSNALHLHNKVLFQSQKPSTQKIASPSSFMRDYQKMQSQKLRDLSPNEPTHMSFDNRNPMV